MNKTSLPLPTENSTLSCKQGKNGITEYDEVARDCDIYHVKLLFPTDKDWDVMYILNMSTTAYLPIVMNLTS